MIEIISKKYKKTVDKLYKCRKAIDTVQEKIKKFLTKYL